MINQITPVLLTYNEAPNIGRTLTALQWAKDIVVVDSFSTDDTEEICKKQPQVRYFKRVFDNHKNQWNFAIGETSIKTDWILSLDADYLVPDALHAELAGLEPDNKTNAYYANFIFAIHGRPLAGSLYPPIAVLFRKGSCAYIQDGHTQRLQVQGNYGFLKNAIILDDRKTVSHWIVAQSRYAKLEADKIGSLSFAQLGIPDKLRKMLVITPWFVPLYTLIIKKAFLTGWHGMFYCFQRAVFESMLTLYLMEDGIKKASIKYDKH
jgi:glycosyltransferase involved in cell wall biosynthesis